MVSRFAVICSPGIGDALILSIASHYLKSLGHDVTTIHPHLPSFGSWLEPGSYSSSTRDLFSFDAILLQHDNSPRAQTIAALKTRQPVYILYPNYRPAKHGPLRPHFDFAFDETKTMVDNVVHALTRLFGQPATKQNVLTPPSHLTHRKYPKRIAIHPTSGDTWRNWPKKKFLTLANRLEKKGFQPAFLLAPHERSDWPAQLVPSLPTLEAFASFLYESGAFIGNNSGPGHLASCLNIPHIILGHQKRHMLQWKPGWLTGTVLLPYSWIPNFKGLRLREKYWNKLITTCRVLKQLEYKLTF